MTPDPAKPETYPRRLLLLTTGLNPQVVTETLFALAVTNSPAFVPTDIHIVTTSEGADRAKLTLLAPDQDHFGRLCREYHLPETIRFDSSTIHILNSAQKTPLSDIRNPDDNRAAADRITALVRELTADAQSALHVSLAGGRKTLGFYLGYALSLFGRPQDRLSHVLVSEPFEALPTFFFPPRYPVVLISRGNKPVSTRNANVTLAEIPFVRLREGMPESLLAGTAGYSTVVENLQRSVAPPELTLDPAQRRVICGEVEIRLPPAQYAFYAWMARLRLTNPQTSSVHWAEANAEGYLAEYRTVVGRNSHAYEQASTDFAKGFSKEVFEERKSRVNCILRKALGAAAQHYLIVTRGHRPRSLHGIELEPRQIRFLDPVG